MIGAEYYKTQWGGSFDGSDEELAVLLSSAAQVVESAIYPSGFTADTIPPVWQERYNMAVCAQADYIEAQGGIAALSESGIGGSVTIGKFSYSGGSEGGSAEGAACSLCLMAQTFLRPTGLLYKGVDVL